MSAPRCSARDPHEIESWVCYMPEGHDGPHRPKPSAEARAAVLEQDDLNGALFEIGTTFNIPLTNNGVTWLEPDGSPVYCVGDFIDLMREVIAKHAAPA